MRGWGPAISAGGKWLHVARGQVVGVVCLAGEPWCYVGHWVDGAMRPCKGEECKLCEAGVGSQTRMCLEVMRVPGGETLVWEFGAATARKLREAAGGCPDIGGFGFRVSRQGAGRGQLVVEYAPEVEVVARQQYGGRGDWWEDARGDCDAEAIMRQWWHCQGWV